MLKFMFTFFMTFSAIAAAAGTDMMVLPKLNQEQRQRMKNVKNTGQVRSELMQPFSAERLQELENAAGMSLVDMTSTNRGGRVVHTEQNLSVIQIKKLKHDLETVPWVFYANLNALSNHMDLPFKKFSPQGPGISK